MKAVALISLWVLLVNACNPAPALLPSGTANPALPPSSTARCPVRLVPMPTGEKVSQVIVIATPPARAAPGESILMELSEGYGLIGHYARVCGKDQVIGYVFADELPDFNAKRTVRVDLDNQPLVELQCEENCRIAMEIPRGISLGKHMIRVQFPSYAGETIFEIEIMDEGTPLP